MDTAMTRKHGFIAFALCLSATTVLLGRELKDALCAPSGTVLDAKWEYSTDGGKTFGPDAPKIAGTHTVPHRTDAARAVFTIDDPANVGLLKVAMKSSIGGYAITDAKSVEKYNVPTCPTLMNTRITLNGKETTAGHLPFTLYAYLSFDPNLLKKGENTLLLRGNLWHKNYPRGAVAADMQLEILPIDRAELDRLPILGMVGEDYVLVLNGHASHCSPGNYKKVFDPGAKHTIAKIDPLLVKHRVTATIGSIHRCYERVEPPANQSVPTILTGQAGGLGWHSRNKPNPHSRAFSTEDHYCIFEVKRDGLAMKAIDFEGNVLDTRTFKPRGGDRRTAPSAPGQTTRPVSQ